MVMDADSKLSGRGKSMWNPCKKNRSALNSGREEGFFLVELLIAISVMSIGFLAMGVMLFATMKTNAESLHVTEAQFLVTSRMEELKSLSINDPASILNPAAFPATFTENDLGNRALFTRVTTVQTMGALCRRLTVEVRWQEKGNARTLALSGLTRGGGE